MKTKISVLLSIDELYQVRWALKESINMDEEKAIIQERPIFETTNQSKVLLVKINSFLGL